MSGFLFDTSSLSLLAPDRPRSADIVRSVKVNSGALHLPTIAIAEIEAGLRKLQRLGAQRKAGALREWLDRLVLGFDDRVLAFDREAAERAGALSDAATAKGRHPGFPDVAVAAIAASRGLVVVTENVRHFEALDVTVVDLAGFAKR